MNKQNNTTQIDKEILKIFAFDNTYILKTKTESKLKYNLRRVKWFIRYILARQ